MNRLGRLRFQLLLEGCCLMLALYAWGATQPCLQATAILARHDQAVTANEVTNTTLADQHQTEVSACGSQCGVGLQAAVFHH